MSRGGINKLYRKAKKSKGRKLNKINYSETFRADLFKETRPYRLESACVGPDRVTFFRNIRGEVVKKIHFYGK